MFWEHHPICTRIGEDLFQYGKRRRLTLNAFGYSGMPLVVSDVMFKDQWEVCDLMNDYDVDFKRGRVKGDPTICFVRNYAEEYDTSLCYESHNEAANLDFPIANSLVRND